MPGSNFGKLFRISTFGESHGPGVGVVIDGCPAGFSVDFGAIQRQLERRRPGQNRLTTQRKEADQIELLSGIYEGRTLGTPIAFLVRNTNQRSVDYQKWQQLYRPSHADYSYHIKYGYRTPHGGGRASARETIGRVAAGALAEQFLQADFGTEILAWVDGIGGIELGLVNNFPKSRSEIDQNIVRCPDARLAEQMIRRIEEARKAGDSIGGRIGLCVRGLPPGLGDPVFDRLEADLAKAFLSIPACKGFEIGSGFAGSKLTGKEHNDLYYNPGASEALQKEELPKPPVDYEKIPILKTQSNHSGGVQGGISNGMEITVRLAFKPTATIHHRQATVNEIGQKAEILPGGRHDPCVLPRAVPIVESMAALVLMDAYLRQRAQNPDWYRRFARG